MTALGIDFGTVRIGIARQIVGTDVVVPVVTVKPEEFDKRLADILAEFSISDVFVGHPISLSGNESKSGKLVRDWMNEKEKIFPDITWHLIDERLSSAQASESLSQLGLSSKEQRKIIDERSAVIVLEHALAAKRKS